MISCRLCSNFTFYSFGEFFKYLDMFIMVSYSSVIYAHFSGPQVLISLVFSYPSLVTITGSSAQTHNKNGRSH